MLTALRLLQWASGAVLMAALLVWAVNLWLAQADFWRQSIHPAYRDTFYLVISMPLGSAAVGAALVVFVGAWALCRVFRARGW